MRVNAPGPGENRCGADDQERPETALEAYLNNAWRTITNLQRTWPLKQVLDHAPGDSVSQRQGDNDEEEPEARHSFP